MMVDKARSRSVSALKRYENELLLRNIESFSKISMFPGNTSQVIEVSYERASPSITMTWL